MYNQRSEVFKVQSEDRYKNRYKNLKNESKLSTLQPAKRFLKKTG